jgi:hypothetical protein
VANDAYTGLVAVGVGGEGRPHCILGDVARCQVDVDDLGRITASSVANRFKVLAVRLGGVWGGIADAPDPPGTPKNNPGNAIRDTKRCVTEPTKQVAFGW